MSYVEQDDQLHHRGRREIARRTQVHRISLAILLLTMSLSARAVVWSCAAQNGDRKFPTIEAHPYGGKGMFEAIIAQLNITKEEYKSLDVKCVEAEGVEAKGVETKSVPVQPLTKSPRSGDLRTDGLTYSANLETIYAGEFSQVDLHRDSFEVASLVVGYRRAFSEGCAASLPKNKVEITENKCEREEWRVNGLQVEVAGSRHCVSYRAVGTGKYADPDVNEAADHLKEDQLSKGGRDLFKAMKDMGGYLSSKASVEAGARKDMEQLLVLNGCASPATKRFQANLIRFALGNQAIGSSGRSPMTGTEVKATIAPINFLALWCGRGCEGFSEPVMKMLDVQAQNGPMVVKCRYETQGGQTFDYYFWSRSPPANIKALLAADPKGILRYFGSKSAQQCPETPEKALQLRQAAMRETGFPPN